MCNNEGTHNIETVEMKGFQLLEYIRNGKTMKDEYSSEDCTWPYYTSGLDVNKIEEDEVYTVVVLNGDYPEEVAKNNKITDTGIVMTEACKEYVEEYY